MFLNDFKKGLSNKIHNNLNSKFENLKNKNLLNSYNKLIGLQTKNELKYKSLLIDGSFYNLGYFYRLQLLRAAIKSEKLIEHAFIWNYNQKICKYILKTLGINNIYKLGNKPVNHLLKQADQISRNIKTKSDILNIEFPYKVPGTHLYDYILKQQRKATLDIKDKRIKSYIYNFLIAIKSSEDLLKNLSPDLVVLSHSISFQCAPIAWIAASQKISTIILNGEYGIPRLWKMNTPEDIFFGIGHPRQEKLLDIPEKNKMILRKIGLKYLKERFLGKSNDLGGKLAYSKGKKKLDILDSYKVEGKKIIAVYVGNWFDFPHIFGMSRFIDILEWCEETLKEAAKNKDVIWLIKSHPYDEWHGGDIILKDLLPKNLPNNIIVLPNNYSGQAVINSADALVTHHGTSAIEYTCFGKPSLVTDTGWDNDWNFALMPNSRSHFLELLNTKWYETIDIEKAKSKAQLFAGLYFGIPNWQKNIVLPDDADKLELREILPEFIKKNKSEIKKEIEFLNRWIQSKSKDYHTYKMENSKNYTTLNTKE